MPWALTKTTTIRDMQHSADCTAKARVTFREAVLQLSTATSLKTPSIKGMKNRIASDLRVTKKSVSSYVAARMRLSEAYQLNSDYDVNWGKLDEWGRLFIEANPGSHFHLEVDKKGRFHRMFIALGSAASVAKLTGIPCGSVLSYTQVRPKLDTS